MQQLADNIRILRKNNGIPQEELANKLNVSRQVISKWETDRSDPPLDALIFLADYYGISLDKLVREIVVPTNQVLEVSKIIKLEDKSMKKETNIIMPTAPLDEGSDLDFFPRISPDNMSAYNKFTTAYNLDLESDKFDDADKRVKAMHLYLEAFDDGVADAAVNMLRVLTKILFNIKAKTPDANLPFKDRVEFLIEKLEELDNQEGQYYHALLLIYGLMSTEDSEEENFNKGIRMMYELVNEGNKYALHYVEYVEGGEEDN